MNRWVKSSKRKPVDVGMYLVAGRWYEGDDCLVFVPVVSAAWWNGKRFYFHKKEPRYFGVKQWKKFPTPPEGLDDISNYLPLNKRGSK